MTGEVKFFNDMRGFGFIQRDDGEGDVFVHFSGLADPRDCLVQGGRVEFDLGVDQRKGKTCATNVKVIL